MKKTNWLHLALAATTSAALASPLPQELRAPGGIAIVPIPEYLSAEQPQATFNGVRTPVIRNTQGEWLAVVGIPVTATPGVLPLQIRTGERSEELGIAITDKAYVEQHLQVSNSRHVNPDPDDLRRIEAEQKEQASAYLHYLEKIPALRFDTLPTSGAMSSPFGLKRFFNGEPRAPHSGLDIAAAEGQEVISPAEGVVVQTGDYFFNGQTVMVDHGYGVVSMMCHLSKIDVRIGQEVTKGERLGLVGKTGRATGPHLHWSVSINNARIDPLLMLSEALQQSLEAEKKP